MAKSDRPLTICDLTQSYASRGGGGVSCYLREKRRHIMARTDHRLIQIVPGARDQVTENGRHIWVEIGADPVPGSPNYRFILRTSAVRAALEKYRPDIIESLCPWVLPWTAINYRKAHPQTALVAGYHTDFPNAHVYRVGSELFGETVAGTLRWLTSRYAEIMYREFDRIYTLDETTRDSMRAAGLVHADLLNLGVDTDLFSPAHHDNRWRRRLKLDGSGPLLIYAGRIDNEKRADRLIAMMRQLPSNFGAALVMLGDGKLRQQLVQESLDLPVALPGYVDDRAELATALASADIYVSAMADETFGISIIEAQASGLPVVGFKSGAMVTRVPEGLGLLGPVDDVAQMARNVTSIWQGDRWTMGRAARAHVISRFSWERTFNQLLGEVYPAALAKAQLRVSFPRTWLSFRTRVPRMERVT